MKCKQCNKEIKHDNPKHLCNDCRINNIRYNPAKGKFIDQFMIALTNVCDKETLGIIIKNL